MGGGVGLIRCLVRQGHPTPRPAPMSWSLFVVVSMQNTQQKYPQRRTVFGYICVYPVSLSLGFAVGILISVRPTLLPRRSMSCA